MEPVCRTVSVHKEWGFSGFGGDTPSPSLYTLLISGSGFWRVFCTFCFVLGAVFGREG